VLRNILLTTLILTTAGVAHAQKWADDMFDETTHDFGVVARGAVVTHSFTLKNIYLEDAHISNVRTSCNCTSPSIEFTKRTLKTWDTIDIDININTRGFMGRKDATITVTLDKPFPAEVQLHTYCYIRSDVVIQPGEILFGSVGQGTTPLKKATVSYAGRKDWAIEKVECANPHVEAEVVELIRRTSQVDYELKVRLKPDAPAGYIRDHLILVTNDAGPRSSRVPVAIKALVVAAVEVRPSPLSLGVVEPGEEARGRLVVKAEMPFRIHGVSSEDKRFECVAPLPEKAATVHLLPVTFSGDSTPGKISSKIIITTDVPACKQLEAPVEVRIKQPAATETSGPVEL
jgi:hypothetical protein